MNKNDRYKYNDLHFVAVHNLLEHNTRVRTRQAVEGQPGTKNKMRKT